MDLGPETQRLLLAFDTLAAFIFLVDFLKSFVGAEDRRRYFVTWGWIDLLSSIPAVVALRWGRAARLVRILRLLRGVRAVRMLSGMVLKRRTESVFLCALLVSILTVFFGAVAVLEFEAAAGGNIDSAGDALWWTVVTISTAGFGDLYPITPEGRLIAVGVMFVGVALFGTLTALFASWLLSPQEEQQDAHLAQLARDVAALRATLGSDDNR